MNKLLLFVALALMCFGIVVVYSTSTPVALAKNLPPEYFLMKHLYKVVASVIIMGVFYKIDYALWKDMSRVVFGVGAVEKKKSGNKENNKKNGNRKEQNTGKNK